MYNIPKENKYKFGRMNAARIIIPRWYVYAKIDIQLGYQSTYIKFETDISW